MKDICKRLLLVILTCCRPRQQHPLLGEGHQCSGRGPLHHPWARWCGGAPQGVPGSQSHPSLLSCLFMFTPLEIQTFKTQSFVNMLLVVCFVDVFVSWHRPACWDWGRRQRRKPSRTENLSICSWMRYFKFVCHNNMIKFARTWSFILMGKRIHAVSNRLKNK